MDFVRLSDSEWILVVLAVLYVVECLVWIPQGAVCFVLHPGWSDFVPRLGTLFPNQSGGFVVASPLPGAAAHICQPWPVSMSSSGIYAYVAQSLESHGRPHHEGQFLRWDEIETISADERDLMINGTRFARAVSPGLARMLSDQLRKIRSRSPARRDREIGKLLAAYTDCEAIRARLARFHRRARPIRFATNGMFTIAFLFAPLMSRLAMEHYRANVAQWALAGVFLLLWLVAVVGAHFAFRAFSPKSHARRTHFLTMCVSPPAAMHAVDIAGRDLLVEFDPLCVASVLCPAAEFKTLARRVLRDLRHPNLPVCPSAEPVAVATEAEFRHRLRRQLESVVAASGVSVDELLQPSEPLGDDVVSYCPRCNAQFVMAEGTCSECGGIALHTFARPDA